MSTHESGVVGLNISPRVVLKYTRSVRFEILTVLQSVTHVF
jgi:hypothetical protein